MKPTILVPWQFQQGQTQPDDIQPGVGENRTIIVFVLYDFNGGNVTSVTYGGEELIEHLRIEDNGSSRIYAWAGGEELLQRASGNSIIVTNSSSPGLTAINYMSAVYQDVRQGDVVRIGSDSRFGGVELQVDLVGVEDAIGIGITHTSSINETSTWSNGYVADFIESGGSSTVSRGIKDIIPETIDGCLVDVSGGSRKGLIAFILAGISEDPPPIGGARPPQVVDPIPDQSTIVGDPFGPLDISSNFADYDGGLLNFYAYNLPRGLDLSSSTGIISGTPIGSFSGQIAPPDPIPLWTTVPTPPDIIPDEPFAYWIGNHVNNPSMMTFALVSGVLPVGLTMNSLGDITGTTDDGGTFPITVRGQNRTGSADTTFNLKVEQLPIVIDKVITAGEIPVDSINGYYNLPLPGGAVGQCLPDISYQGTNIFGTYTLGNSIFLFQVEETAFPDNDSSIERITISGQFVTGPQTLIFLRSDATYNPGVDDDNRTEWRWSIAGHTMISGESYDLEIIYI